MAEDKTEKFIAKMIITDLDAYSYGAVGVCLHAFLYYTGDFPCKRLELCSIALSDLRDNDFRDYRNNSVRS
jgi:hypothetical protein